MSFAENLDDGNNQKKELTYSSHQDILRLKGTSQLINEAAKIKFQRAISLPDCFILALTHKIAGNALFARQEQELADEMEKKISRLKKTTGSFL